MAGSEKYCHQMILKTMVAMAGADGTLDDREIATIQAIYKNATGADVAEEEIMGASEARRRASEPIGAEFAGCSDRLHVTEREEMIRAAYLVLLADDRISGEERKRLKDIAAILEISEVHFGAILEDLAVSLSAQGR